MLYDARTRTLIETNVNGRVAEEHLRQLAALKGGKTKDGAPIEMVALVFVMPGHGEKNVATIKRFGLECRGFDATGVERVLCQGARMTSTDVRPDGPLVPVLREESWPHLATAVHRRLFVAPKFERGPWVTFGWDTPKTLARMGPKDLGSRTIAEVEREALSNLEARRDKIQLRKIGDHSVSLAEEYGAEMILSPTIMKWVASELGGVEMLAVGVPSEHGFLATSATDVRNVGAMIAWARSEFDQTPKRRVSPIPFIVDGRGELVGLVGTTPEGGIDEAAPPKKAWWKFW